MTDLGVAVAMVTELAERASEDLVCGVIDTVSVVCDVAPDDLLIAALEAPPEVRGTVEADRRRHAARLRAVVMSPHAPLRVVGGLTRSSTPVVRRAAERVYAQRTGASAAA